MADVSKIKVENTTYDIKDSTARTDISTIQNDYIKSSDFASRSKAGIVLPSAYYNLNINSSTGVLYLDVNTYSTYTDKNNNAFISKGTLENVITGKGLVTSSDNYFNYSTTEQVIGKWINNKPLYRKVYNTFTFGAGATNNYIILDNATTYNIINNYGKVSIVNNSFTMILGTGDYGLGSLSNVYKNENSGDIYINTSLSQNDITSIEIVLEYTKSTD